CLFPELASGGEIVSDDDFLLASLLDRVSLSLGDGERRVADADWLFPKRGQSIFRPRRRDWRFVISAVAFRTAEVGPIISRRTGVLRSSSFGGGRSCGDAGLRDRGCSGDGRRGSCGGLLLAMLFELGVMR